MGYPFNNIKATEDGVTINTVIEIPKGSMLKAEWDRTNEYFVLDRVEPGIFAKPVNYGFIPQTLDEDGDELDTLVITDEPLPMGLVVRELTVLGVMNFEDGGEMDHKVICVPSDDRHTGSINSLDDLSPTLLAQLEHHFTHYKDLKKPGTTIVKGFSDASVAWTIIKECQARAEEQKWWQ